MDFERDVLHRGDRVAVRGRVAEDSGRVGLLEHLTMVGTTPVWGGQRTVELVGLTPDDRAWLHDHLDGSVAVEGAWTGVAVDLSQSPSPVAAAATADEAATADLPGWPRPRGSVPEDIRTAQEPLWDSGALLSVTKRRGPDGESEYRAIATDPALVARILGPLYEGNLVVVKSRWDAAIHEGIQAALLGEGKDVVMSFGRVHTDDDQLLHQASVHHVTERLAHALTPFPAEALELSIFVRPLLTA